MAAQLEDLETTQAQLEATQSSLIDLESHLTSLEEDNVASSDSASLAQPGMASDTLTGKRVDLKAADSSPVVSPNLSEPTSTEQTLSKDDDAVASAIVSAFDDLFPASREADETIDEAELPEAPLELFEQAKAKVEQRGRGPAAQQPGLQKEPAELFEEAKATVAKRAQGSAGPPPQSSSASGQAPGISTTSAADSADLKQSFSPGRCCAMCLQRRSSSCLQQ